MTNISITVVWVLIISRVELGLELSCMGNVSSKRDYCHADQAVFLLLPNNAAVVLQPVNT